MLNLSPNFTLLLVIAFGTFFGNLAAQRIADKLMMRDIEIIASECEDEE